MQSHQVRLALMRTRRTSLTGMLQEYYKGWMSCFEAENDKFVESVMRFAEEHDYAPPVRHYAAQ